MRIWKGFRDPLGYLSFLEREFGAVVSLRPNTIAVFQPDLIKHILQDNYRNYEKGEIYRAALCPYMGNGLFTSEGAFWLRQRRIAQGAFQRAHLPEFGDTAVECVRELAPQWGTRGQPVAARQEITRLMLQVTLRNLFGADTLDAMPQLTRAVNGVNEEMNLARALLPVKLPAWVPTPGRRRFSRSLRAIDEFIYRVIARRKAAPHPGTDLVGLLVSSRDPESGAAMSDLQLRDELVTMLNAGHDTVTDSIVWTLLLLIRHPPVLQRIVEEIDDVSNGEDPRASQLPGMGQLMRAYHEGIRLYPPGWAFAREAIQEDSIGGFHVLPGTMVVVSPWVVQRSPRYWDRPEEFDPDRFLPNAPARHKFSYFPFGSGPRQCIGMGVAMMTGPLILASLLARFEFSAPEQALPKPSPRISLKPAGEVWLSVRTRARRNRPAASHVNSL